MFTVNTKPLPVRAAQTRELSPLASNILATFRGMEVNQSFDVPNVYTEADVATFRPAKEGGKRDPSTERDIKVRAIGTLAGKMAAKLSKSAKVADAGNGAVTVWLCAEKVKSEAEAVAE